MSVPVTDGKSSSVWLAEMAREGELEKFNRFKDVFNKKYHFSGSEAFALARIPWHANKIGRLMDAITEVLGVELAGLDPNKPSNRTQDTCRLDLVYAAKGRRSTPRKDFLWAYENLLIPWSALDPKTVPGPGAVSLLTFAKKASNENDFFRIFARLVPAEKEGPSEDLEEARFQDADRAG